MLEGYRARSPRLTHRGKDVAGEESRRGWDIGM